MLRKNPESKAETVNGSGTFAVVASRYNARYVDAMLRAAKAELWRADVSRIQILRVPGAYEIPLVAKRLARTLPGLSAIVCLGVILRGETAHAAHIGDTVSRALMEIQLAYEIPVIHEVLVLENEEQARVRCLDAEHNRGTEAARTALAMVHVLKSLQGQRRPVIVPMILILSQRARRQNSEAHKKIARWTWPLWLYVSVTGALVYWRLYVKFPQT